jgi:hypothetical protein
VVSTGSSATQAFLVEMASIGSGFEINSYAVSATVLTFAFLEKDYSTVLSSLEESAFHFFFRRVVAFLLDMAIILPLQIP